MHTYKKYSINFLNYLIIIFFINMLTQEEVNAIEEMNILKLKSENLFYLKKIGEGGQGKVFSGAYKDIPVAIKKLLRFRMNLFEREIKIQKALRHPYVPSLYGYCFSHVEKDITVSVVSELIQGKTLQKYNKISKPTVVVMLLHMIDLCSILCFCHGVGLIHRDLKPDNVMVDNFNNIKLLDFGISKFTTNEETETKAIGTVAYMAPENFTNYENTMVDVHISKISKKVDVWAFGLMLNEFFSGDKLYDGLDVYKIMSFLSSKKDFPVSNKIKNQKLKALIEQCVKASPDDRPDITQVKRSLIFVLYEEIKNIYVDVREHLGPISEKHSIFIFL